MEEQDGVDVFVAVVVVVAGGGCGSDSVEEVALGMGWRKGWNSGVDVEAIWRAMQSWWLF